MDLVHDERIAPGDQVVLEPPPGDAGGHDDDVPCRRLRRRLTLAVDHTDLERLLEDRFGNRPDAKRLADARAGDDAEALAAGGPGAKLAAVLPLEDRVDVEPHGQFDRLASGTGRRNHDYAATRRRAAPIGLRIGREKVVAGRMHAGR